MLFRLHTASVAETLASLFGNSREGRVKQAQWLEALATLPTLHSRRKVLEHVLRTVEWSHQHGGHWRVTGPEAYIGRQHETEDREIFDQATGEVRHRLKGQYTPDPGVDTIAMRSDRSVSQCHRYRSKARALGLIGTSRTPGDAPDGTKPWRQRDDGTWAYAHHWVIDPSPELKQRWIAWSKKRSKKRKKGRANPPKRRMYSVDVPTRQDELDALGAYCERDDE